MAVPNPSTATEIIQVREIVKALHLERSKFTAALVAQNTRDGYRFDQADFRRWCLSMELQDLPATGETLSLYVTAMLVRGLNTRTCGRRVAAVLHLHRSLGLASPDTREIRDLLRGARRMRVEKIDRVLPLNIRELRAISVLLLADGTVDAIRNWAMLLVGFAGALRNSSTAALLLSDVAFFEQGAVLSIRKSKTDQDGRREQLIGLPYAKHPETCPVTALKRWIGERGTFAGPLFSRLDGQPRERPLLPERIGEIVRECIERAGLDSKLYGGHSLRAGFCTEAGMVGAGDLLIAATTGHRDMSTLRVYFRRRDLWERNVLGLMDL